MSIIHANDNWEASYDKGWLTITNIEGNFNYRIQLKDAWTGQNTTLFQFNEAVERSGLDKAVNCFKVLSPQFKDENPKLKPIRYKNSQNEVKINFSIGAKKYLNAFLDSLTQEELNWLDTPMGDAPKSLMRKV